MNFSIRRLTVKGLEQVVLREETSETEVAILPGHGASLHTFRVRSGKDNSFFNVIDNYTDLEQLEKEMGQSFKNPKLSPFPCRIPDGRYKFNEQQYEFANKFGDGTAIHGLLFNKPFDLKDERVDAHSADTSMEYRYNREDAGYPFEYSCNVRYILHPGSLLEIVTTVTNLDQTVIPVADGWHPYFQLGGKVDEWMLQFQASAIVEFDDRLVPTGRLIQYAEFETPRLIGDTFLDNCFALKPELVSPSCEIYNPANGVSVSFLPDSGYPFLQLYTPPSRKSIAVENLSSAPDSFNNKMGLILLQPGHSQIFTVRYKVGVA